jgi:diacylglycerol kinase family enzyme
MFIAPEAELDDGRFDVVCLGDLGFADFLLRGRRIYAGTHLTMDKVSHRRATTVRAEPVDPRDIVELDVDGETPGILPATFTLLPRALSLVVPQPAS